MNKLDQDVSRRQHNQVSSYKEIQRLDSFPQNLYEYIFFVNGNKQYLVSALHTNTLLSTTTPFTYNSP